MSAATDLTESELFSLYAQYPDINFDTPEEAHGQNREAGHFSSPCSHKTTRDETQTSNDSMSTAQTTPLRPSPCSAEAADSPSFPGFLQHVRHADLPESSKSIFRRLAHEIKELGSLLLGPGRQDSGYHYKSDEENIWRQGQSILAQLRSANYKIKEQTDNISFIKTLAPFTVEPALKDLWCNYRQQAHLIAKYTAPPCRTEKRIIEELAHLFDALVYHPFLLLLKVSDVQLRIQDRINELYDALMSLLHNYNLWWSGMKEVRQKYMLPTLRRIQNSPETLVEIREFEKQKEAAKAAMGRSEVPGMRPTDERVIQELNLITSHKPPIPAKSRDRYRREQTI